MQQGSQSHTLLVIDDNPDMSEIIATVGAETGFEVTTVNDYDLIRKSYREVLPDLITLDLDLGVDEDLEIAERGFDGLEVLQFLAAQACKAPIIIISGSSKDKRVVTVKIGRELGLNVIGSLAKPFEVDQVEKLLQGCKDKKL